MSVLLGVDPGKVSEPVRVLTGGFANEEWISEFISVEFG